MSDNIFKLKNPLQFKATGRPNIGYLFFPADEYALSFMAQINPTDKVINATVYVVELATGAKYDVAQYFVTQIGFPTGVLSNQKEIDEYQSNLTRLTEERDRLMIEAAKEADTWKPGEPTPKSDELAEVNAELAGLVAPVPMEVRINPYDEVIGYLNPDATLNEQGLNWCRTIRFLKGTMGDYIV